MNKSTKSILLSIFGVFVIGLVVYLFERTWMQSEVEGLPESNVPRFAGTTSESSRNRNSQKLVRSENFSPSSDVLSIGEKEWHLDMGDVEVDSKHKASIYQDINRVMRFKKNPEITPLLVKFELKDGRRLDRRVSFMDGAGTYPSPYQSEYFLTLFEGGKEDHLFIHPELVEEYERVVKMELDYEREFIELDAFLGKMENLLEKPIKNLSNLFIVPDGQENYAGVWVNRKPEEFAKAWGGLDYTTYGRINVKETKGTEFEIYGSLVTPVYAVKNKEDSVLAYLAVYAENQWRIMMFRQD